MSQDPFLLDKVTKEVDWNIEYYSSRIVQSAINTNELRLNDSIEKLKIYSYLRSLINKVKPEGESNDHS